jgi:zinc protease
MEHLMLRFLKRRALGLSTSRISALAIVLFAAALALPASALTLPVTLPAGVKEVTSVEGVTEYLLESNGLRVLLAPDPSKPSVTVNMTYLVGARHENYGQTGMAHLLEHMIFKGTPSIRNALAEFSKRGLRANGTTSEDRTNYFATFAANPETLDWFIRWQADAMVNSLIAREDLDAEMTVVRNEMERGENSPFRMLFQKTHGAAFQWHNYGKSVIGARSDVEGVDIEQLQAFYRAYYQPDNAVLVVAGQFDPTSTLTVIADAFGVIPKATRVLPREYTIEPVQDGERRVTLRRNGGTPLVAAVYHIPPAIDEDYPAIELATLMLSDAPSGRLYKALVPDGLASSVFGFSRDMYSPGTVMFGAQLDPGMSTDKALGVLTETLETVAQNPMSAGDLERARSQWLNSWEQVYSDVQRLGTALSEPIALGDWRLFFKQRDRIEAVSLEHVQRVATAFLTRANRTEGIYIPTDGAVRAPAAARGDLTAMLEGYVGRETAAAASGFDPSPANIDKLTQRKVLNLPSGSVKLALLPKETRGDRVTARMAIRFANAEQLKGKATVSSVVADMLTYGTRDMTRQQISDRLDALQADLSISGSGTSVTVGITTTGKNLPAVIDLALHLIKDANFPEDQRKEYISQVVTGIRGAMSEPGALASNALARYENPWPADDIRYAPTFEESITRYESVTREALVKFHEMFYGGGNISLAAVGSFDPEQVVSTVTNSLKNWREAPAYTRVSDPYRAVTPTLIRIDTPDKANAVFSATLPLPLQDTNPDYPALVIGNYMLGSSANSRLWMRIREQDGLSYDVRSQLSASAFEPTGRWSISGIFAPDSWVKFETALNEELQRAMTVGFSDEELAQATESLLNLRELFRAQDNALVSAWLDYLNQDRTFAWSAAFDEKLKALDATTVNATIRKHLDPKGLVRALAGDF